MPRLDLRTFVCSAVVAGTALGAAVASDWPQFYGPTRNGISTETGLNADWSAQAPKERWRIELGDGYSGISVVGDRLYTMFAAEVDETPVDVAAAFDANTGKEIWRTTIAETQSTSFGAGPRSTPAVDGDMLYVLGFKGDLVALKTGDGSEVWRVNYLEAFDASIPFFGYSSSPLVDGDLVIVETGGKEKSYAGIDKKTGKVRWTQGTAENGPGYNSPQRVKFAGGTCYVYILGDRLACVDKKGNQLWTTPWVAQGETHAMPVFVPPNKIFAAGIEGVGARMFEIGGKGAEMTATEVWNVRHMKNHMATSILIDEHIYGFDNATLRAISVKDGSTAWAKRGLGKGTLIVADGQLIVLSDKGALVQVEATPDEYREIARIQAFDGRCWTAPTLSNGKLFLRTQEEMVSYDLTR